MKIHALRAKLFHAKVRHTDMTKLMVAFRNVANVPNKRKTFMSSVGFKPAIPKTERPPGSENNLITLQLIFIPYNIWSNLRVT